MPVQVSHTQTVERPVAAVFDFMARDHARNHPRWDENIELEQVTGGPVRVGTIFQRLNKRGPTPIEGTMQVTEFEPNRALGVIIREGPLEMRGRITFAAAGDNRTVVTRWAELPDLDPPIDTGVIERELARSEPILKALLESQS